MLKLLPRFSLELLRQALKHPLPDSPNAVWHFGPWKAWTIIHLVQDPAVIGFVPASLSVDNGPNHVLQIKNGGFWQISPLVPGAKLPRPVYLS